MKITAELLAQHSACSPETHGLFTVWPDGVDPTGENINTARVAGMPWQWLPKLLDGPRLDALLLWCRTELGELSTALRVRDVLTMLDAGEDNKVLLAQHLIVSWVKSAPSPEHAEQVEHAICDKLGDLLTAI